MNEGGGGGGLLGKRVVLCVVEEKGRVEKKYKKSSRDEQCTFGHDPACTGGTPPTMKFYNPFRGLLVWPTTPKIAESSTK